MSLTKNKISIVIVNYNAGNYLLKCVSSVLQSTFPVAIWVVDNASSDSSLKFLKEQFGKDHRLHIIENSENLGFSCANNKAIAQINSEYILFLNPDCYIAQNDVLAEIKTVMDNHPEVGMAGCLIRNSDGSIQPTCVRTPPNLWNTFLRVTQLSKLLIRFKWFKDLDIATTHLPGKTSSVELISGAFMFVRRSVLKTVGLLDENYFLYCEDIDWMLRFRQAGWQILFIPSVEIFHAKSVSSKQTPLRVLWYKHKGMRYFYKKFYAKNHFFLLNWLVYIGIGSRYILLSTIASIRLIISGCGRKR